MKRTKKLMTCLLALAMVITMQFPGSFVFAEDDVQEADNTKTAVSQEVDAEAPVADELTEPEAVKDNGDAPNETGSEETATPQPEKPKVSSGAKAKAEDPIRCHIDLRTLSDNYTPGVDITGYTLKVRLYDSASKENLIAQADVPLDNSMLDATPYTTFEMPVEDGVSLTKSSDARGAAGYFVTYYIYDAAGNMTDPDEWENGEKYAYVNSSYKCLYWQNPGWTGFSTNDNAYGSTNTIYFLKTDAYESWTPDEIPHVTENTSGTIEFHPMTDYSQIQGAKHYIIMTQSPVDNEWYAFANNDTGYQVIMDSLSGKSYAEITNPDFTYKMTANDVKSVEYVYKAKDVSGKNLKLYTNQRDEDQKEIKLKLGWSASSIEPVFSTSSGNITLEKAKNTNAEWVVDHESLNCLEFIPELFGGSFYGVNNTYGAGDPYAFNNPTPDGVNSLGGAKTWGGGYYSWLFLNHWPDLENGYYYAHRYGCTVMEVPPEYDTPEYVELSSSYKHPTSFIILTDAEVTEVEEEEEDIPATAEEREYAPIEDLSELNAGDEVVIVPADWFQDNKVFSNVRDDNNSLRGGDFTKIGSSWDDNTIRTSTDNAFILGADTGGTSASDGHRKFASLKECKAVDPKYARLVKDSSEIEFQNQEKSISFYTEASSDSWNSYSGAFFVRGNDSSCWLKYTWQENGGSWEHVFANGTAAEATPFFIMKRQKYKINYHYVGEANDPDFADEYDKTKDDIWKTVYTGNSARVKTQTGEDTWNDWAKVYTNDYKLLGWTTDPDQPAYLGTEDSCNLFEYDPTVATGSLSQAAIDKYKLIGDSQGKFSLTDSKIKALMEKSDDGKTLDLYPIFCKRGFTQPVSVEDSDGNAIIGAGDWKDYENLSKQEYDWFSGNWDESWLGKINVEVYKDGELWCDPLPLYYMYHNDNSADLNVKFIVDDLLDEYEDSYDPWGDPDDPPLRTRLDNYLLDGDVFPEAAQVDDYVIDYAVAMQGSKEDGLKYKLNWMSESGGQLDNVRGGSTVKVYVTTKYQAKYFLDGVSWDEASGELVAAMTEDGTPTDSVELTEEVAGTDTWVNALTYATTQTEEAAEENEIDITVSEDENSGIFDRDTEEVDGDQWYMPPEEELRSTFGTYLYDINRYDHEIPTPIAPESLVPEGYVLVDGSVWEIRDEDDNTIAEVPVSSSMLVHIDKASAGTHFLRWLAQSLAEAGITDQAFKADADDMRTYHLHMKIKPLDGGESGGADDAATMDLQVTKEWEDEGNEDMRPESIEVTLTINGEPSDQTITITEGEDWIGLFEDLPVTDENGDEIEYGIQETPVEGYESEPGDITEIDEETSGIVLTNTYTEGSDDPDDPGDDEQGGSDDPNDSGDQSSSSPDDAGTKAKTGSVFTGDSMYIELLIGTFVVALAALIGLAAVHRRRRADR